MRKFTEEVPREKVLVIEDVMDAPSKDTLGDLKVRSGPVIEHPWYLQSCCEHNLDMNSMMHFFIRKPVPPERYGTRRASDN